ncbi:SRPBCC family protein [Coralliovum pocilloporae]|uniref:SRPBCC family protein n=1 Tax=Coralliovum pocilloporae TaxID=3066369 RepID=UPI00330729FE
MDMKGEYRIPASREAVWDALNDPDVLRASIPGCERLDKVSDTELEADVTSKIGPVKAKFKGSVTLSELNPPESYVISGEGKGGVAGFANGGATVRLAEDGHETILTYEAHAKVGGKLAQLGSRLIDSTAKKMADQFFSEFSRIVAKKAAAGGGADESDTSETAHEEGVVETVVHAAQDLEEKAEVAAAKGFLGGSMMWGWIAIAALVVLLAIFI